MQRIEVNSHSGKKGCISGHNMCDSYFIFTLLPSDPGPGRPRALPRHPPRVSPHPDPLRNQLLALESLRGTPDRCPALPLPPGVLRAVLLLTHHPCHPPAPRACQVHPQLRAGPILYLAAAAVPHQRHWRGAVSPGGPAAARVYRS